MSTKNQWNLVWFRDDLRVGDHPALSAAMATGRTAGVYVLDEVSLGVRPLGSAAKWWLHHALVDLRASLEKLGVPLILAAGPAQKVIEKLTGELNIHHVHWNRRYALADREVDRGVKTWLTDHGYQAHSHDASLLAEPWTVSNQQGEPYKVFSAFYRCLQEQEPRPVLDRPSAQDPAQLPTRLGSQKIDELNLLPTDPDWSAPLAQAWQIGEDAAWRRLGKVTRDIAADYAQSHDRPDIDGTSQLSPALRWGHLSARQVWQELQADTQQQGTAALLRQVGWRDFCWHLLYHFPQMSDENFRPEYDAMPWRWPQEPATEDAEWRAWIRGETGFRLVDAGMMQLWQTGWMHNRVRMVVASFLVKNLQIHWKAGEQWFWDTLVDADQASNVVNWQWVAGSGTDAAPFFRVFNPELQAKKFDPQGSYAARFAPVAHEPLLDLKESRAEALAAYEQVKKHP